MAYTAPIIKDRVAAGDNKYTMQTLSDGRVLLTPSPDEVEEAGTEINKSLLQPLVDSVALAWTKLQSLANIATSGSFNDLIDVPGKVVAGQYTGTGKYGMGRPSALKTNARAITFPFTPSLALLASSSRIYPLSIMQGYGMKSWGNSFGPADISDDDISYVTILSGNKLYITNAKNSNDTSLNGGDVSGEKYAYVAFA